MQDGNSASDSELKMTVQLSPWSKQHPHVSDTPLPSSPWAPFVEWWEWMEGMAILGPSENLPSGHLLVILSCLSVGCLILAYCLYGSSFWLLLLP